MKARRPPDTRPKAPTPTTAILESISDGVFTVDLDWRITYFNRAAEEITGVSRDEAVGRRCSEVFRSSMCEAGCALRETMQAGRPIVGRSGYIVDAAGNRVPVSVSTAMLRDENGAIVGGAETFRDLSDLATLRDELAGRHRLGGLTSRSPVMRRIFAILPVIAASESTVLILGETGTGKELVARAIHDLSPRAGGPFVALNCGALPETLLESELFGHKAGAFTGADRDRAGRFAAARGGTLFLDEIGEISPALQVRLLRVLQEHSFEPLGSNESEPTDVRVLVATNRDLDAERQRGAFRDDLFYRIDVIRIELPALRERREDVPLLVAHFIERLNRLQDRRVPDITPEALSLLMAHDWPGNVRELENVVERAFVLCGDGPVDVSVLPRELTARLGAETPTLDIRRTRSALDSQAIRAALTRCDGNRTAAARELGIHKSTLFRLIRKLGITLPERDGRSRR